ncbi:polymer-forming cytoskeletal protein [Rheinheimera sp.]|uniref:polymer-forming cytoskeletal protein n=1 Tax=Rheinheimera sp. TaxID=1869214 RepID=UPI00307F047C
MKDIRVLPSAQLFFALSGLLWLMQPQAYAATYNLTPPNRPALCSGNQGSWSGNVYTCTWGQPFSLASGDTVTSTAAIKILSYSGFNLTNVTLGSASYSIDLEAQGGNITRLTGSTLYGSILGSSNNVRLMTGTLVMGAVNVTGNFQADGATIYGAVSANNGISATNTTFHSNLSTSNSSITLSGGRVKNNVTVTAQSLTATGTVFEGNITANGNIVLTDASVSGKVTSTSNKVTTTNSVVGNGISGHSGIQVTGGTIAGDLRSGCNNVILTNTTMTSGTIQTTPNLGSGCGADRVEFNNSTINANILGGPNNVVLNDTDYTGNIQARFNVTLNDSTLYGNIYGETNYDLQKVKLQDSIVYGSVTVGTSWQTIEGNWPNSAIYGDCTYHTVQPQPLCQDEPPPPAGVNHFRLSYPVQGLTCQSSAVLIEACADASCSSRYTDAVTVTLSASGGGAWGGGNQVTLSNGMATKYLSKTNSGDSVVGISATSVTASAATVCLEGTTTDSACSHSFLNTGLRFSTIPNQVAGLASPATVKLQVVRTDTNTGACVARVTPTSAVQFGYQCVNPTSCITGQSFTLGTTAIAANPASSVSQYTSINRSFNSSAETEFTIQYSDVGQLKLHARLALAASGNEPALTLVQESNSFVVKPDRIAVTAVQRLDGTANPATTSAGSGFVAAGQNFKVQLDVLNREGNRTPNFGQEIIPEQLGLQTTLAYPVITGISCQSGISPCTPNPDMQLGSGGFTGVSGTAGRFENSEVSWLQAGSVNLSGKISDNDYLGAGSTASANPAVLVGRFYPDRFVLSAPTAINSCVAGGFSYMSQPAVSASAELRAVATDGSTVLTNYNQASNKQYTGTASIQLRAENAGNGVDLQARLTGFVASSWLDGRWSWAQSNLSFAKLATLQPDGPYSSLQLGLKAHNEMDGRDVVSNMAIGAVAVGNPLLFRYGRLMIENAFGPEDEDLPIQFATQYWHQETNSFVRNAEDQCTAIDATHLAVTGVVTTASGNTSIANGLNPPRSILLPAPGVAGSAALEYDLNTGNIEYLGYPWSGGTSNQNPTAEAVFGRYRGNKRQIYWQEQLN